MAAAETACLADEEARECRRLRAAERREELDKHYVDDFARRIRELFPNSPSGLEKTIAEHACLKYSGRVGRSAAAKALDDAAIRLAVIAHLRHAETPYDELLASGYERFEARRQIEPQLNLVLAIWQGF